MTLGQNQHLIDGCDGPDQVTGKAAVDIAGYQILPEDDEVESEGVSMDSESADDEEVSPPPGKRKLEAHPEATASKAAKADASSQPNQAAKQVNPAASNPNTQQPKTPPAKAGASVEVGGADFIASPKFTGSRAGFVFKKGAKGVGYYRDTPPSPAKGVAAAAAQPKKQSADEWAKEVREDGHGSRFRGSAFPPHKLIAPLPNTASVLILSRLPSFLVFHPNPEPLWPHRASVARLLIAAVAGGQTLAQREWKAGPGGLRYRDLAVGAAGGATPRKGQRVTVHYTGRLAKGGKQFDSSVGRKPFVFSYGRGEARTRPPARDPVPLGSTRIGLTRT